jgi:hypothetical protein
MANRYISDRYVEQVDRLALGLEPIDAGRLGRVARIVRVQLEDVPQPHTPPRRIADACAYDFGLPAMDRHPSSRYALLYAKDLKIPVTVRLFDCKRWFVPRRLRIPILTLPQNQAAETAAASPVAPPPLLPPQPPVVARVRRPVMFPGAAYQTDTSTTGLRGRVFRGGRPMRWARVEARDPASNALLGRAHGDDRGEFFLIVGSVPTPNNLAQLTDPVPARIRVFGPSVAPVPTSPDPDRLDPLWDLPIEVAPAPGEPDPISSGDVLPAGYVPSPSSTRVVDLPVGQVTSAIAPFVFA